MNRGVFQYLILLILVPVLLGCGDNETGTNNDFIGDWVSRSIQTAGCSDEGDNKIVTCDLTCITLTINDTNFTKIDTSEDGVESTINGTITISQSDFILCDASDNCSRWAFVLNGTTLVLSSNADADGCVVSETYTKL